MLTSLLTTSGRYKRLLAPVLAAIVAGAVVAGVSLATDSTSSSNPAPSNTSSSEVSGVALQNAFVNVVQSVSPSVVQIQDQQGLGSGIVLDAAGDIVTNNHVVVSASALTVTTSSGKRYPAKLVGSFPPDDLAVIKVSGANLKPATFGDSSKLAVGDLAIAIGNPLGLQSSVTEGIVSAFRQAVQEEGGDVTLPSVIQTSAAINPGNSGGAWSTSRAGSSGFPPLLRPIPSSAAAAPRASASQFRATSSRTSPARSSATGRSSTRSAPTSGSAWATRTGTVSMSARSRRAGLLQTPGFRSET